MNRWTLSAAVAALWVLVAVMMGMQAAVGAALQGQAGPLWPAVRGALLQTLPWIPVTLAVIAVAVRFPVDRARWRRSLPVHLLAVPLVAFLANAGVVIGFQATQGALGTPAAIGRAAAYWAVLRLHVAAVLYVGIAALTMGVLYLREVRRRELSVARREGQLATARLQALTAQIRPHFLFNTLHTIGQLWRSGRGEDADAMLDHLGSLLQRVQSTTDRPEVPLEVELETVADYLAIERSRFPDRLRVEVSVAPDALACPVPPLLLQPLVENAVRHGVSGSPEAGRVSLRAAVADGALVVEVEDDGPGRAVGTAGTGTGLRNVRERLREMYGEMGTLEAGPAPTGGFVARVRLPDRRGVDDGVEAPPTAAHAGVPGA